MEKEKKIILRALPEIKPYPHNPRINDAAVHKVAESIRQFGFRQPIIVDADGVIVAGHTRYKAAQFLRLKVAPDIVADDLTPKQAKAYRLADNKTAEFSLWDDLRLATELRDLSACTEIDLRSVGFDTEPAAQKSKRTTGIMAETFGIPPFSILDTTGKQWAARKKEWLALGIRSEESRDDIRTYSLNVTYAANCKNTVSVFDPVLCEMMYRWFGIPGGKIFDPFAGGSVRGVVAAALGYEYIGIDLRREQVEANEQNAEDIGVSPTWICEDSRNMDKHIPDDSQDMIFTCPPYADLEVYSNDPADISNKEYPVFLELYQDIMQKAVAKLKQNRFAVVVVGEVRGKDGSYYNFVGDTIRTFISAGMRYYNEIILATSIGTLPIRAGHAMAVNRKIGKRHQNVLVFYKGEPKSIHDNFPRIALEDDAKKAVA